MCGIKLLLSRYAKHRIMLLCLALFFVGMMAAVMVFHADPGNPDNEQGDYIMCKLCANLPAVMAVLLPMIFMAQETQGSRFLRAVPDADRMYRLGIPLTCTLITLSHMLVTDIVYSAFILISGRELVNICDMLVLSGVLGFIFTVALCCMLTMRAVGIILAIIGYWTLFGMVYIFGKAEPLGVPLWGALAVLVGGFAAGFGINLLISGFAYRVVNFREVTYAQSKMS